MFLSRSETGFTLVELAVVLVIVGLLIGGVLKGVALVDSAKEKELVRSIMGIRTAVVLFRDQHDSVPGDMPDATDKIPGCIAAAGCAGGDGNGLVGSDGSDNYDWLSPVISGGMGQETVQFWKHLALAGLITGVEAGAPPDQPAWGLTHPAAPHRGGFEFYYDADVGPNGRPGHILRLSDNGIAAATFAGSEILQGALTPHQAAALDIHIDDGNPSSGLVLADYGTASNECKETGGGGVALYREADWGAVCILYINMGH